MYQQYVWVCIHIKIGTRSLMESYWKLSITSSRLPFSPIFLSFSFLSYCCCCFVAILFILSFFDFSLWFLLRAFTIPFCGIEYALCFPLDHFDLVPFTSFVCVHCTPNGPIGDSILIALLIYNAWDVALEAVKKRDIQPLQARLK